MAVFRVEKNTNYTVMSNHHLRNLSLTLKAKGLLSQMLSLPADWDFTLRGLSLINRESIDAIRTAVWELEKAGYIIRRQGRDEKGKMAAMEYIIYEHPQEEPDAGTPNRKNPEMNIHATDSSGMSSRTMDKMDAGIVLQEEATAAAPVIENSVAAIHMAKKRDTTPQADPVLENPITGIPEIKNSTANIPILENPTVAGSVWDSPVLENPISGKPMQINKELLNKDLSNKEIASLPSLPILTPPESMELERKDKKNVKDCCMDIVQHWERVIKEKIEYSFLSSDPQIHVGQLNEIVSLIVEMVCSKRQVIRIAGDDYPAQMVRSRFRNLDGGHIRLVMDSMKRNTTRVRNIKQYLLAALFNAAATIENYYVSLVNHDLYGTD